MIDRIYKFPRTAHIEGSGLQRGDEDLEMVSFARLQGATWLLRRRWMAGIARSASRHWPLTIAEPWALSDRRRAEAYFDLFKTWANRYYGELGKCWEAGM